MKFKFYLFILLLLIYTCDRQLTAPVRDNPFDSVNGLTSGDIFNLQTQNQSGYILVSWEYTYEKPVIESFLLYRVNGSGIDTLLYTGLETTFEDNDVVWDSTYLYYVTGVINKKETPHPEIDDLPEVMRRIYVGEDGDYTSIGDAINSLNDGDVVYVRGGTYQENVDFGGKKLTLICNGENPCIINGNGENAVTFTGGEDSTAVLYGFTITGGKNNDAYDGGGMTIRSGADPLIQNCTFTSNSADRGGGVFVRVGAKPSFIGCSFETNTSAEGGGAIFCDRYSKPKIDNCTFTGNQSTTGNGGAIYCERESIPVIENCIFSENTSSQANGGAIYVYNATPEITNCDFTYNQSNSGSGGALYIEDCNRNTVSNCNFTGNNAKNGGAVLINQSRGIEFKQCRFVENTSDLWGGAVYINLSNIPDQETILQNCIFWNQSATFGGAIFGYKSKINIIHCALSGNRAEGFGDQPIGGGLYCTSESELLIKNSIFHDNLGGDSPHMYFDASSHVSITFSDIVGGWEPIEDNWEGEYNIFVNPLFVNPYYDYTDLSNSGDFHLQDISPCIFSGENGVDMGAYGGIYGDWE